MVAILACFLVMLEPALHVHLQSPLRVTVDTLRWRFPVRSSVVLSILLVNNYVRNHLIVIIPKFKIIIAIPEIVPNVSLLVMIFFLVVTLVRLFVMRIILVLLVILALKRNVKGNIV